MRLTGIPANSIHWLLGNFSFMFRKLLYLLLAMEAVEEPQDLSLGTSKNSTFSLSLHHRSRIVLAKDQSWKWLQSLIRSKLKEEHLNSLYRLVFNVVQPTYGLPTWTMIINLILWRCELIITVARPSHPFPAFKWASLASQTTNAVTPSNILEP